MRWNKIKRIVNSLIFNTPFISISIGAITIIIVCLIANNTYVKEFYVGDATLRVNAGGQVLIVAELDGNFDINNKFMQAYWYTEKSADRRTCKYVSKKHGNGKLIVTYAVSMDSTNSLYKLKKNIPITIEIVKNEISLTKKVLGDIL